MFTDFGDWSKYLDQYDPYRDGKGALRMGSFLQYLMEGFRKNMKKSDILEHASEKFSKERGRESIIRA